MTIPDVRDALVARTESRGAVWLLGVILGWQLTVVTSVWAQATIDVPPLSDWLNTVAWYGLVPILRILGAAVFVAGLVSLRSSGHGGASGLGLVAMVAGGILLLVPEIVNAIYTKTTVGASWATTPGS
ncbi:MAG: hypothetical protein HOP18_19420 [Deltaproteobacteria bacterium]|nr:hypothetical protein [Deltaproteobacteria bacterium]